MTVIERAEQRMEEEERNNGCVSYWSAYLDGARRQKKEDELLMKVVDAVPVVHGEWEVADFDKPWITYRCLNCGGLTEYATHFCPNCGAKMDGKEQDG